MAETAQAKGISFSEKRREQREHGYRQELRKRGIHTRELVLLKLEACETDLQHWYTRAQAARFLNGRMMAFLRMANERCAESKRLLAEAEAECARLRELIK